MVIKIPGQPVPKLRPRFSKYGTYDPQSEVKQWYRVLMLAEYKRLYNSDDKAEMMQGANIGRSRAFDVTMYFHFTPPAKWSKKRRKAAIEGKEYHTSKPDVDNLVKFVFDCANGILFPDDKTIVSITAIKKYAEKPYTFIEVRGIQ